MAGDDDFAAWLRLLQTKGVSRGTARRLLAACGSPGGVLAASNATLRALSNPSVADALQREPPEFAQRLQAALTWLAAGDDRHAITVDHPAWPPLLLQTPDPPLLLFVQGDLARLSAPALAVVGTRQPTAQGRDLARSLARTLGEQGFVVVSGLAQGIDAAAHQGALGTPAGTVAVVGCGPDRVYPPRHRELAALIAAQGAVVSEFAPGTPPLAENFPQRNRIIAGLSLGTVVVEAALRSGSLITARLAAEAGREVFAVPGSVHANQSKGCHALIRQGAKLVESAQDIFEELQPAARMLASQDPTRAAAGHKAGAAADPAGIPGDPLFEALGDGAVTLDALIDRTGWTAAALSARLLELELEGAVARLPGGLYQRRHLA